MVHALLLALVTSLGPLLNAPVWLNGQPSARSLRGKVVVVDVFTFNCINCIHVVPELRKLRDTISPARLAILGIHTPETDYERVRANVVASLAEQDVTWPIAVDDGFDLWRAYGIRYWPTQLIFDRDGRLRKTLIGEGQDGVVESTVRELLAEPYVPPSSGKSASTPRGKK